jgi:hypothetical protein
MVPNSSELPPIGPEASMATVRLWRTVMGAAAGVVGSLILVPLAGLVWGATTQATPCYGGAAERPWGDRVEGGALFGMLAFFAFDPRFTVLAVVAGAVAGSVLINVLPSVRAVATGRVLRFLHPPRTA